MPGNLLPITGYQAPIGAFWPFAAPREFQVLNEVDINSIDTLHGYILKSKDNSLRNLP